MTRTDAVRLIDLQIMWNRLIAVVEEQAQVLIRTAFSPIVRECGDLSAGVFDLKGRMIAQAVTGTPGHVNSMAESVKHFVRHFPIPTMRPGDAYITNDPWMGTGHLNDFVVTTPAFHNGKLVALFSCTSHLMDIGGIGFGPDATDVFMEGLYIPMLKLIDQGTVNETLMAMIRSNTRLPIDTEGDTYSLAACNDVGAERLAEMMREFGIDSLDPLADHIISRSREAVMAEVEKLPKGTWHNAMTLDGYDKPVTLVAALTVSDQGIHVDYTGTSAQSRYGINVPLAYTTAYTVFGLGCVVASRIPNNAGSLAPLTVAAPSGSILKPVEPQRPRRDPVGRERQLRVHHDDHQQRRDGCASRQGRAVGDRLSERRARHAGRDRREPDAADLLEEGAAAGLRRRRAHPGRAWADHRNRQCGRSAVGHSGGVRPHRSSGARARWRP